jgi:peptidyl-prolyl cis-trans isomerase A (cyclophilin A)
MPRLNVFKIKFFICTSLFVLLFFSCNRSAFKSKWTRKEAPEYFRARFETTKGNFEIESYRKWSPQAVDRLYQLLKTNYYTNAPVYRVVPDFVVQWGGFDTSLNKHWREYKIPDEPVVLSNVKGTMGFARGGKESRSNVLFINLKDNLRLDTVVANGVKGYPGVAKVISGMDIIPTFFSYEPRTVMARLDTAKNAAVLLQNDYPKMDYIKKAYLIK